MLLPSTNHISCPTPSGVCAGMYRFVGNDPGVPGRLNPNYNPRYRVIATEFEAMPGVTIPTDLAPTQVGTHDRVRRAPASSTRSPARSRRDHAAAVRGLAAVRQRQRARSAIDGTGFGAHQGTGQVTLDGTDLPMTAWSDTSIDVTVPAGTAAGRRTSSRSRRTTAQQTANGLTFHVLGTGYQPDRARGRAGQAATRPSRARSTRRFDNNGDDLVVVYPARPTRPPAPNPRGAYYENLIMASPVKLQGVGPGRLPGQHVRPRLDPRRERLRR